jgi:DNA polymerase
MTGGVAFGRLGLELRHERIALPNGLSLHYPELRREPDGRWRYAGRRGRETLYGGKIIENVIQALARIVVMDQQQVVAKEFRVVFSVHDEIVCCVPEDRAEACRQRLREAMATPPAWAAELPLACEAAVGRTYGDL